jgi:hypothetical protein
MERELKAIVEWLTNLGLKVNESKTEVFLIHRLDYHKITINLNN